LGFLLQSFVGLDDILGRLLLLGCVATRDRHIGVDFGTLRDGTSILVLAFAAQPIGLTQLILCTLQIRGGVPLGRATLLRLFNDRVSLCQLIRRLGPFCGASRGHST
jgi:hypothetical protein